MSFKLRAILALFAERSLNLVTKKIHLEALTNYPVILVHDLIILVITCVLLFNAARTTPLVVQQNAEN